MRTAGTLRGSRWSCLALSQWGGHMAELSGPVFNQRVGKGGPSKLVVHNIKLYIITPDNPRTIIKGLYLHISVIKNANTCSTRVEYIDVDEELQTRVSSSECYIPVLRCMSTVPKDVLAERQFPPCHEPKMSLPNLVRSKISGLKKIEIKDSTYHEKSEIDEIFAHLAVGEISLWYSPFTDFTEGIIKGVQEKFQIPGEAIREFNSKEDLLKQFGKNTTATIAAVNFIGNDSIRLNYEIGMYDKYFRWNTDKLFMPTIIEDDAKTGIQWNNMIQSGSGGEDDITMGNVLLMLIFDTVIFMLLTLYIENVKPGEYGIAKPYNFFLPNLKSSDADPLLDETEIPENICIQINKLFKKYNHTVAVDNLSMNIRENEITVLLGHNGAGKTTTMSILTGMINATKGTVIINGKDIKKETDQVRKDTGLCPQHNLLFMDLTVREHLKFLAMLKGSDDIDRKIEELLVELGLDEKANSMAYTLSGGMKRKLCLGMALIGDSKVLILDEPTSGMDPESRRKIWNLLLECRKTKTILISTHFMEEADILGDRIAIMANGSLQCYDTPMRLKVQYNTGYHLSLMLTSKKYLDIISREIKKQVLGTHLLRENSDTVVYLLPLSEKYKYRAVFELLEKNKNQWNIAAISLNITTLNDVFLKAKDEIDGKNREVDGTNDNGNVYSNNEDPQLSLSLHVYGKTKVYYGGNQSSDATVLKMRELYSEAVLREGGSPVLEEDVIKGIIGTGIANIAFYKQHMIAAAEFNDTNGEILVNSMYSKNALHGVSISINLATNAIVKALFNESFSISISNTPLKPLYTEFSPSELSVINVTSIWFILMPLRVNGAGKSTTFRMLTKQLFFDKGQIAISEGLKSTSISKAEYSEKIGYCPQEDCLNYYQTGRELLYDIAHIKGYSTEDADKIIKALLNRFDLNKYADKLCLGYSGGNKRKLNCCLAFLGSPSVILLDEPTSGVDPASRRNFWKIFSYFKEHLDTSFLLSSHSMEECENLCDE
ncbi:hypothetical protein GEV33_007000 [Tenebrio molitor]|uniref:ABC transporter domain-containing protein n=1 Tax=Tenebrio molitor TaxID=7067 RepID=A0A8J6HJ21_TENMO|nr:hypothetical protein GEV33_007000 [Tenebrio molitor]